MTTRKTEQVTETIEHSFEGVLGIPSGTTEIVKTRIESTTEPHEDYDAKDNEIEEDFLYVHDKAMELYEQLVEEIEDADQSRRPRFAEVAGQILRTALDASERRRVLKQHIDTTKQKDRALEGKAGAGKTTNNVFMATHEEMIAMMQKANIEGTKALEELSDDNRQNQPIESIDATDSKPE